MAELTYTEIPEILGWFKTGDYPTQQQFEASWTSFWHKSELIPVLRIEGIAELLEGKADSADLQYYAKTDATNIDAVAWRTVLGVGAVDLSNYYTKSQVNALINGVTVDLTNYHTITQYQAWVSTATTPATQAEVEASTGTESQPLSAEPATESRKFLSIFNFFKLIKKLRYIHLLPNSATAVANRLRSDGAKLYYANNSAVEKTVAYTEDIVSSALIQPYKILTANTTLDDSFHNCIIRFTANVVITVPNNLRADFNCAVDAFGNFTATFLEGGTATFSAPFGKVIRDNAMCTIYKYSATAFRINGGLTTS